MNYRTVSMALQVTLASDPNDNRDVLVHVACLEQNPGMTDWRGDYEFEDGVCCDICGNDLLHAVAEAKEGE